MAARPKTMSRLLEEDDMLTLTSFNLFDGNTDEADQEGVLSKFLYKVRNAVVSYPSLSNINTESNSVASIESPRVSYSNCKMVFSLCVSLSIFFYYFVIASSVTKKKKKSLSTVSFNIQNLIVIEENNNSIKTIQQQPLQKNDGVSFEETRDKFKSSIIASHHGYETPPITSLSTRISMDDPHQQDGGILTKTSSNDSDNQSVMTNFSASNYHSLNRVIAQLRGEKIKSESINTEYWMPDSQCKECFDCNARFKFYRRKHHCRICGRYYMCLCGDCIFFLF